MPKIIKVSSVSGIKYFKNDVDTLSVIVLEILRRTQVQAFF